VSGEPGVPASHVTPCVSVVMSVYNGSRYLRRAVESILCQTLADLEFVIVDDGSTDGTPQILDSYDDPRIVRVLNHQNIGLTRSLNRGIHASSGPYIARQDADDWSLPGRLALQLAYLEAHPQVGLVGSGSRWIDGEDQLLRDWQPESDPVQVQQKLLWSTPFLHGTFLFRRACLDDLAGGYDESMPVAQDCELLLRIADRWELANLPEILYVFRQHGGSVTASRSAEQKSCLRRAQQAAIERRLRYGLARVGLAGDAVPQWVRSADRRWLARRFVLWSSAARNVSRTAAAKFLAIALMLDPTTPGIWVLLRGFLARNAGLTARGAICTD
jgi:glycosyltransferase involved in cell wall biosynthesis